jgi:hypothetical protein
LSPPSARHLPGGYSNAVAIIAAVAAIAVVSAIVE